MSKRSIKESPEEVQKLIEEERESPTYTDDGGTLVTCAFCSKKISILSGNCCDEAEKRWNETANEIYDGLFKEQSE